MIYRVESRQTSPLESVKAEVVQQIYRQKMEAKTKELNAPATRRILTRSISARR